MRPSGGAPQGESIATWTAWGALLAVMGVTHARIDPALLYHVSRDGVAGGLSRVLVELNFPIALVAIALALLALDALPRRALAVGVPAIALCAVTAWPGVVEQADLDARPVNAIPALGVALALGLTVAAALRAGPGLARRLPLDGVRIVVAVVALLVSIPWLAAEAGTSVPDGLFVTEPVIAEADGTLRAAVHLGHHHGLDGTFLLLTALLLSRPRLRPGRLGTITVAYVSLAFAYGSVNLAQDLWHEQVVKRGWSEWQIPTSLRPELGWIWLVILGLAALTAAVLRRESRAAGA